MQIFVYVYVSFFLRFKRRVGVVLRSGHLSFSLRVNPLSLFWGFWWWWWRWGEVSLVSFSRRLIGLNNALSKEGKLGFSFRPLFFILFSRARVLMFVSVFWPVGVSLFPLTKTVKLWLGKPSRSKSSPRTRSTTWKRKSKTKRAFRRTSSDWFSPVNS